MLFERCEGRWFTEKGLQEKKWKLNFPIDRNFSSHEKEFRLTKRSPITRNNPNKGLSASYSFSKSRREIAIILQNLFLSLSTTDRLLRSMGETLKRWIPMVIGYTARKTILETRTCTSSSSTVPTTYDVNRIEAEDRSKRAKRKRKNWAGEGRGRNRDRIERESWHHPGHAGSRLRSS